MSSPEHPGENEGLEAGVAAREAELVWTDLMHIRSARRAIGYDDDILCQVDLNITTDLLETAMPFAVSTTVRKLETDVDHEGRAQTVLRWLGRTAVESALNGYHFYTSDSGRQRVAVEVDEAQRNQSELRPGMVQVFISPRYSKAEASPEIAAAEHLADDDAVRIMRPITDSSGNVVAGECQSLLVRDIPLAAWVAMLRDPQNIFGQSFWIEDETSSLAVMQLFDRLDMPEAALPGGPVTLVEAVVPYIHDIEARLSVADQVLRFKSDQEKYRQVAQRHTREMREFMMEIELSEAKNWCNKKVEQFIGQFQHQFGQGLVDLINDNTVGSNVYMSEELAVRLVMAKRHILRTMAAIETGNPSVLKQMDGATVEWYRQKLQFAEVLRAAGVEDVELHTLELEMQRRAAVLNLEVKGGCAGGGRGELRNGGDPDIAAASKDSDKENWSWKTGVCRTKTCPSPKPTDVGPCNICRKCQDLYDHDINPEDAYVDTEAKMSAGNDVAHMDELLSHFSRLFDRAITVAVT